MSVLQRRGHRAGGMVRDRSSCPGSVNCCGCLPLCAGLEWTRFGEAFDRFHFCVVLGDALGGQMWIVEARSHHNGDTLDCSGFHVVDAVRLRTTIACQPDDRGQPQPAWWLFHLQLSEIPRPGASSCTRLARWCSRESHAQHLREQECASIRLLRTWPPHRWLGHVARTGR